MWDGMKIDGDTSIMGILGDPVNHSLSPVMHNAAFRKLGLNYRYFAFHVSRENLPSAIKAITALQMVGVSVTAPHKEQTVKLMHELSPDAAFLNAVNTVKNTAGRLKGFNTDIDGFIYLLETSFTNTTPFESACLLGAGGAARAVALALARYGIKKVIIANRTIERAETLAKQLEKIGYAPQNIQVIPLEHNKIKSVQQGSLLINGLSTDPVETGIITTKELDSTRAAVDLRYNPEYPPFLQAAQACGLPAVNGLKMLLGQGIKAFEIFTGVAAPTAEMEKVLFKEETLPNIFLTGFMGSGKTTTARLLANMLDLTLYDCDDLITAALGTSIEEIFRNRGEEYFRHREMEIIKQLAQKTPGSCVVATGGGAVLREENITAMQENGIIIHLEVSANEASQRLQNGQDRPLLDVADPQARIKELRRERAPYYRKANYHINTDGKSPKDVAEEICNLISR